jgi:diaminohydroxyphosphoribosylaminopyrimidine deaminase / 5-amino-6-(5-phosphoribosylamino)uracil reductase
MQNYQEDFMRLALELAAKGSGKVSPNPMVGCVIVKNDKIIATGFHQQFGGKHAEAEAIDSVNDKNDLIGADLYVTLEPCNHFGKTPPCSNLILTHGIKRVIIGTRDSNPIVNGKGIDFLKLNGIEIEEGILEKKCREINKRFFTFHEKKRPYIILKWAQTADGYISRYPVPAKREENLITGLEARKLTHQWRSEEDCIMVGTNTVRFDDPILDSRLVNGKNPVKIIIDRNLELSDAKIFKTEDLVLVLTEKRGTYPFNLEKLPAISYITTNFGANFLPNLMVELYQRNYLSVLIEGGTNLLNQFLNLKLFDELRIFYSPSKFENGIKAPTIKFIPAESLQVGNDSLKIYRP